MSANLTRYEQRLLRWERYLRRTRHVTFWLGCVLLALPPLLGLFENSSRSGGEVWAGLAMLLVATRHI